MICLPEVFKLISGGPAAGPLSAADGLGTGDYISLKNAVGKAYAVIVHQGTNDTDLTVEISKATDVAGTGAEDITDTLRIWKDDDFGSGSDTLVRQTDAATNVIDASAESPAIVIIEVDPAALGDFDCVAVKGNNGHASNDLCVLWFVQSRYPADPSPTMITD